MRVRASLTVEASLIFPILILLTAFFLNTAIDLYDEAKDACSDIEDVAGLDCRELFWDLETYED